VHRGAAPGGPTCNAVGMDDRYQARDITVRRDVGLEVVFEDGETARFGLAELRDACPCAHCRGAREEGRAPYAGDPGRLAVRDAALVGAWGLRLVWHDGHDTGIYPWENLRRWADAGEPQFAPDSGRAG
jgi:DUF971 family protein